MTRPVPAVTAAARILRHVKDHPDGVGVSDVSRALRLSKSTSHGILKTLAREGLLVEIGATRRYRLGGVLVELADAVRSLRPSVGVARPFLEALARELGLACFIATPYSETEFLIVEKAEGSRGIRVTVSVGERFPLTAGAAGKAYLAWQPRERAVDIIERVKLPVRTRTSITSVSRYLDELGKVRAQGFAECYGEHDVGTHALAAPVFDAAGETALLLITVGFPSDLDEDVARRHGKTLRGVAERVTRALGGDCRNYGPRVQRPETLELRVAGIGEGSNGRHARD